MFARYFNISTKYQDVKRYDHYDITTNVDDLEISAVNIQGLEDYIMPAPVKEFHLETSSIEESEREEWVSDNNDNGNNNCITDFKESSSSDDENED